MLTLSAPALADREGRGGTRGPVCGLYGFLWDVSEPAARCDCIAILLQAGGRGQLDGRLGQGDSLNSGM